MIKKFNNTCFLIKRYNRLLVRYNVLIKKIYFVSIRISIHKLYRLAYKLDF